MNPEFAKIGEGFIKAFYQAYDSCTTQEERAMKIQQFYHNEALFQFEDAQLQGRDNIMGKIKTLSFNVAQHVITKADFQPTLDGGVLMMITGQLKVDQDRPLGFSHVFQLKPENNTFFIMHEIFRLTLHDFDASPQQQC